MSGSTFTIARHAFMTVSVPDERRARALSVLGGVSRLGLFVGPGIATVVIVHFGTRAVFFVHAAACVVAIVILLVLPDPDHGHQERLRRGQEAEAAASARSHLPVLLRLGGAVALLAAVRASKSLMIPLWALHNGLSASQSTAIVTLSAGSELLLFYASGQIMDRYGRLSAVLPCLGGLVLGHVGLLFTNSFATLLAAGIFLGLVNGLGSGIQLTLGSDIAPKRAPARVLGAWRLFGDTGSASSPLVIAALIAVDSLLSATVAIAVLGAVGCALMVRYVPRFAARQQTPATISRRASV
jgi:MFS family permease